MKSIIFSRIIFFISLYLFTINIARAESNDDLTVNKINIIGNVSFSDKELKEYLRLKEDNLYRDYIYWIDLERLEEFYHKRGYLQIIIEKPKTPNIEQEDNKINCFFNIIEEGNCTLLDSVIIINNQYSNKCNVCDCQDSFIIREVRCIFYCLQSSELQFF